MQRPRLTPEPAFELSTTGGHSNRTRTERPDAAGAAARLTEERLGTVLAGLPDAVIGATADERIVFVNDLAGELFGYAPGELIGQPVERLWPGDVRELYTRNMRLFFATEQPLRFTSTAHGLRADGSQFVGEMSWGIVPTGIGPVLLAIGRDVTAQRRSARHSAALAALGEHALSGGSLAELARTAAVSLHQALDADRVTIRSGPPDTVLAAVGDAAAGATLTVPIHGQDRDLAAIELAGTFDDADTAFVHAAANLLTIAAARRQHEDRVRFQALHDPLTGAGNRTLLADHLAHALERARRGGSATVLLIDLDGFKQINDTHGHLAGDAVLGTVAARLKDAVRPHDTVARIGGDEFVILCEDVGSTTADALADRLHAAIRAPIATDKQELTVTASVGIARTTDGTVTPEQLLARADTAVYHAKTAGHARTTVAPADDASDRRGKF
jgi:diguanylate cyclase (GGDEF)-like protein/PAS domain S-box-containing protein